MQIEEKIKHPTKRSSSLSPMNQLLIALRFYATGSFQLVIGDTFAVDNATVCRTLKRVTEAIAGLSNKYVKLPETVEERRHNMRMFYNRSQLPGIIGAVDCTHVPIQSPGSDDAEIYRNRKGYMSVNVQLVCDCNNYISNAVVRWPGAVHDSTIFDNSQIRALFETGRMDGCLVGDGGYACRQYMLTPLLNPATAAERAYNSAHVAARNCIERTNGLLKRRFPCLKYGMRLHLDNILPVIVATVVLHNIAVLTREEDPDDDEALEHFINNRRQRGLQVDYAPVEALPPTGPLPAGATGMRRAIIDGFNV